MAFGYGTQVPVTPSYLQVTRQHLDVQKLMRYCKQTIFCYRLIALPQQYRLSRSELRVLTIGIAKEDPKVVTPIPMPISIVTVTVTVTVNTKQSAGGAGVAHGSQEDRRCASAL